jgi:hypothetical protein
MKLFVCDQCAVKVSQPHITIRGVEGSGGILLPAWLQEKDFCSQPCFWMWIEKNKPKVS